MRRSSSRRRTPCRRTPTAPSPDSPHAGSSSSEDRPSSREPSRIELRSRFSQVIRLAGVDRYETAAAVSAWHFTAGASKVYIATGTKYLDALVAGPRAAADGAPLLLVGTDSVPEATAQELRRLGPSQIVIVGSSGVVSDALKAELNSYATGAVTRIAGRVAVFDRGSSGGNGIRHPGVRRHCR